MECLYSLININPSNKEMICLVGAGGKTSSMFRLAHELSAIEKSILVTTTTAIYYPERKQYDEILVSEKETLDLFDNRSTTGVTVFGRSVSHEGKLLGVSPEFLDEIFREGVFDYILVEGDGSKGKPLKASAEHEPVIPRLTTKVMGLIGLDCIGKAVSLHNVHRPELLCGILGCTEGDIIDTEAVSNIIVHKAGLFKGVPASSERFVVLNKADGEEDRAAACDIVRRLSDMGYKLSGVIISSLKNSSVRGAVI